MNSSSRPVEDDAQRGFITSTDIAAEFGVARPAVSNWRRRYGPDSPTPFPPADADHPIPMWRRERWPEIHAWNEARGGHQPGVRKGTRKRSREGAPYLSIQDIADRLTVSASAVRQWLRKTWPVPFPPPDTTDVDISRTIPYWLPDRLPDIQRWREWHLRHLNTRSTSARPTAPDNSQATNHGTDQGPGQGEADHTSTKSGLPSPAQFVRDRRSTARSGARQGRIVRPSVQRRMR